MKAIRKDITFRWFRNVFSFVLVLLVLFELVFIVAVRTTMYNSVSLYLSRRNETNSDRFSELIREAGYDFYSVSADFMSTLSDTDKIFIEIFDGNGKNIISSDGFSSPAIDVSSVTETSDEVTRSGETGQMIMTLTSPLCDNAGNIYGVIRYTVSVEKVHSTTTVYIISSLVAVALVAVLVFISGLYFIRSIVKPVNGVISSAEKIAKGDFSIRVTKKYDDEIGKLSDAINNMASELSKIDKLKNDFISSISHELRTPLTAIRGWNETISMCDPQTDEEMIKKGLSIIASETERLSNMVEELLDYSKIQSGRFTISRSEIDLFEIMDGITEMYTTRSEQTGIELCEDVPDFDTMVIGDTNRIKQVYINIIDNAFKHSDKGGKIEIKFGRTDDKISVIIKDHGHGIKKDELPFIKERFYKGSSTKPGSGLGLAVCDEIINLHGGSLDIDSVEGEGTTVTITLPAEKKEEE